ncbi:MAG: hypothetical protein ABI210_00630 [Abditibacteriaceae bacterium]
MSKDKYNFKSKVKPYEIIAVIGIIVIMILISTQVHNPYPLKVADPVDINHLDRRTANLAALDDEQIVPGKSVGKIRIGGFADNLAAILGKPQLGDAAMCKSWSRWEWGDPLHVLEVFESCDPDHDMKKTVQQILFSGIPFKTQEGISSESTFAEIQQKVPTLRGVDTFKDKTTGKQMIIMDQKQDGIAFVFDAKGDQPDLEGRCHMIIIHPRGKKVLDTYLQPEWDLHPIK